MTACWLVRNGVPFHTAFDIPDDFDLTMSHRLAMAVAFGRFEGQVFNWDRMAWEAPR